MPEAGKRQTTRQSVSRQEDVTLRSERMENGTRIISVDTEEEFKQALKERGLKDAIGAPGWLLDKYGFPSIPRS